ncbi:MAG TPA: ParB N-terminal domain-containing protein [bacterium]|nr:ParB N-terminal domain-containing protein [bacterium]
MKIALKNISVAQQDRIRTDPGDISSLRESIGKLGLLNPIVIDENGRLVAGYRRYCACRDLGMEEVPVRVGRFHGDLLLELEAEAAENLFRKDFTPEEIARMEERRKEIIRRMRGNIFQRIWRRLRRIFRRREPAAPAPGPSAAEESD